MCPPCAVAIARAINRPKPGMRSLLGAFARRPAARMEPGPAASRFHSIPWCTNAPGVPTLLPVTTTSGRVLFTWVPIGVAADAYQVKIAPGACLAPMASPATEGAGSSLWAQTRQLCSPCRGDDLVRDDRTIERGGVQNRAVAWRRGYRGPSVRRRQSCEGPLNQSDRRSFNGLHPVRADRASRPHPRRQTLFACTRCIPRRRSAAAAIACESRQEALPRDRSRRSPSWVAAEIGGVKGDVVGDEEHRTGRTR